MGFLSNVLLKKMIEKRQDDVIRVVETISPGIRKRKKAESLLGYYKKNANVKTELSNEQLDVFNDTWKDLLPTGIIKPDWAALYTEKTGEFSPEYIGSDLHYYYVEYNMIDFDYLRAFCDKNYIDIVLPSVKHPETLIRKIRNMYLDKNFGKLTFDEALELIYNERHKGLVIKISRESSGGKGVTFIDESYSLEQIKSIMNSGQDLNVQYVIKQHSDMARMNESSINTIRIITMLIDGESIPLSAVVRIGASNSKVDNFSSGGVACGINDDGTLKQYGYNAKGDRFEIHSNGFRFPDGKIPNYSNVVETVKKLHYHVPIFGVANWDIAIDELGEPVLIEYNIAGGQIDLHQYANGPVYGNYREKIINTVFKNYQVRGATLDYNYSIKDDAVFITKGGGVKNLVVPQTIEGKEVKRIYDRTFQNNMSLHSILFKANLDRIGYACFYNCSNLKKVKFVGSVTEIARSAFNSCSSLKVIKLPAGLKIIGRMAFRNCPELQKIVIPSSVTEIADDSFMETGNVVIHCRKGSYAEQFAITHGIKYKSR